LAMSSSTSTASLPSGLAVLTTFPDVLFIPEMIFGGLVWILVASSKVPEPMLQGWVMFVSVFCFVMTTTLLCLYICGAHGGSSFWVALVSGGDKPLPSLVPLVDNCLLCRYCTPNRRLGLACVVPFFSPFGVFAFLATLMYVIHKVYSLLRWKSS
ncbi:MAL protein, partial [Hydrobates tethys]|nr:MAL protein [Oceanodroma tethys]